jgi:hypothetical protein
MVRRGSTVRVRQRALQKRRIWRFFFNAVLQIPQYAVGMEPFLEPSDLEGVDKRPKTPIFCALERGGSLEGHRRQTDVEFLARRLNAAPSPSLIHAQQIVEH